MSEIETTCDLRLSAYEMEGNRWYYERQRLRSFPTFELLGYGDRITAAEGTIDTQYGNTYAIRIALDNYPYSLPKIFTKGWEIHPVCPHRFSGGSICVMRSSQWRTYHTIALVVAKTAIWLAKYEKWKRNGHRWPGLEQKH